MHVATQFLTTLESSGILQWIISLFRPQHPVVRILTTALAALAGANDVVVDALLSRRLRMLTAQLETITDAAQRLFIEKRVAAIAAAVAA